MQAALALGRSSDPRAVPPLIAALKDDNETVRGMAVNSLALLGDERALEPLLAMRKDNSPYVAEHTHLIESIRAGKPHNELKSVAESTPSADTLLPPACGVAVAIAGQVAAAGQVDLVPHPPRVGPPDPDAHRPG